ncbi:ABC transporter permease [Cellulomonas chengniuliangii]|uniref:ABC transporter permease n=1 Tax=Cellulomonas chengniuliangii TaxID=2968084 RepID=A0ABY5L2P5_9CELL|nr:ABC transporter permease subunit [Cellulomonas chengniuliangii]MCC2307098.1 ABC transporter permease [Cellulomonas chengniuliangii]MCC2316481.1 ABC transporter permease [Cellulomonas chengniuliangii]UUI76104.1 ABC transporter permease [Cellulomonas chengniuliangii]
MSTTTLPAATPTLPAAPRPTRSGLTFGRLVASEWIKFRSLRSTWWTLAFALGGMVGISLIFGIGIRANAVSATDEDSMLGVLGLTFGYTAAQLALAVLGALTITGEYSTGMIRSTLAAAPRRLPALWAKLLVLTMVTVAVSFIGLALSYLVTLPLLSGTGVTVDLGNDETVRALLGVPLYLTAITLMAFAIGAIVRHSAGAITTTLGIMLVVPMVFSILGIFASWAPRVGAYMPTTAGEQIMSFGGIAGAGMVSDHSLSPWAGIGLLGGYVVVLLAVAAVLMRRRDA